MKTTLQSFIDFATELESNKMNSSELLSITVTSNLFNKLLSDLEKSYVLSEINQSVTELTIYTSFAKIKVIENS